MTGRELLPRCTYRATAGDGSRARCFRRRWHRGGHVMGKIMDSGEPANLPPLGAGRKSDWSS